MTIEELAKRAGRARSTVTEWANGKRYPNGQAMLALCEALRCTPNDLYDTWPSDRHAINGSLGKACFTALTNEGEMTPERLHELANVYRMRGAVSFSNWFLRMAEAVRLVELRTAKPKISESEKKFLQLTLF